jgi:hypothetical protein
MTLHIGSLVFIDDLGERNPAKSPVGTGPTVPPRLYLGQRKDKLAFDVRHDLPT